VSFAILVAAEANLAFGGVRRFVADVAALARLVFGFGVQSRQLRDGMTRGARGHARDAFRTVRTVAGLTAAAELTVHTLSFGGVALGARFLYGEAGMRLVAARACLVPLRGGLLLGTVATAARGGLSSGVGLVAAGAHGVTGLDEACFARVAARAGDFLRFRVVGKPLVAAGASLVPAVRGDLVHARAVARVARREVRELEAELVRLVAARAGGAAVRRMVIICKTMARAASLHVERG